MKLLNIQAVFFSDIFIENSESEKFCLYLKLSKRFGLFGRHIVAIFNVNVFLIPGAKVETAIAREYLWFRRVICKILGHHSSNNLVLKFPLSQISSHSIFDASYSKAKLCSLASAAQWPFFLYLSSFFRGS